MIASKVFRSEKDKLAAGFDYLTSSYTGGADIEPLGRPSDYSPYPLDIWVESSLIAPVGVG